MIPGSKAFIVTDANLEKLGLVELLTKKLDEYGLTLDDLVRAISTRNMNVPGGTIKFGRTEFIIRTVGEFETTQDIADLIVRMDSNGRVVRVKHVATVKDTLEEAVTISKLDGEPAVNLYVYKKAEGNIISVMKEVRAKAKEFEERIPGLKADVRSDGSIKVRESIQTLTSNALLGILLVFIILTAFLETTDLLHLGEGAAGKIIRLPLTLFGQSKTFLLESGLADKKNVAVWNGLLWGAAALAAVDAKNVAGGSGVRGDAGSVRPGQQADHRGQYHLPPGHGSALRVAPGPAAPE